MNNKDKVELISCNDKSLFGSTVELQFGMYSFDRIARLVIQGLAEQMLDDGCTKAQVIDALKSKDIRWMLDKHGSHFVEAGKYIACEYGLSESAKEGYNV